MSRTTRDIHINNTCALYKKH